MNIRYEKKYYTQKYLLMSINALQILNNKKNERDKLALIVSIDIAIVKCKYKSTIFILKLYIYIYTLK